MMVMLRKMYTFREWCLKVSDPEKRRLLFKLQRGKGYGSTEMNSIGSEDMLAKRQEPYHI